MSRTDSRHITIENKTRQRISLARLRSVALVALDELGVKMAAINIVLVGEKRMATLAQYKGKSKPTNVLAFAYREGRREVFGDVVLCMPFIRREAKKYERTPEEHLVALLIHGIVHLTGRTHANDVSATQMERFERRIASRLGLR